MRSLFTLIFSSVLGTCALLGTAFPAAAQAPAAAASRPGPNAKTLFLVRGPDGVTPMRAVSYQLQSGGVLVLVNEKGGRAVIQTRSVLGRLPWASDEDLAAEKVDLAALANSYETSAILVPMARKFLLAEAARFRAIIKVRETAIAVKKMDAGDKLNALMAKTYAPTGGYSVEALEKLLALADAMRAAMPDAAGKIDKWGAPFREHLANLKSGSRYENGAWITRQEIDHRTQIARKSAFLHGLDYRLESDVVPPAAVRGLVTKLIGAVVIAVMLGLALLFFARRRALWRLAGIGLVAGSPLALAMTFFLATRTPDPLPSAPTAGDEEPVVSALADAAGLNPSLAPTHAIPEAALNVFLARHVRMDRPSTIDPWAATREAIATELAAGRLSIFELVRCLGFTFVVRYDLMFSGAKPSKIAIQDVHIGDLDCPDSVASALWLPLKGQLTAILAAMKIPGHFAVQSPTAGEILLTVVPATTATVPPSEEDASANASGTTKSTPSPTPTPSSGRPANLPATP